MQFNTNKNKGQTLVEIIVAFGIVTLVLVALISAITVSLANTQYTRNKAQATAYGQEAIEWLRTERDTNGWSGTTGLYTKAAVPTTPQTYCISDLDWTTNSACTSQKIGTTIFTRQVKLTGTNSDTILATIDVSWNQGARTPIVSFDTILTKW